MLLTWGRCAHNFLIKIEVIFTEFWSFNLDILGSFLHFLIQSLCNQLLPHFSVHCFWTLNACCWHEEDMLWIFGAEIILEDLWPFGPSNLGSICTLRWRVCVINSYHNFLWIVFNLEFYKFNLVFNVGMMKMCMWFADVWQNCSFLKFVFLGSFFFLHLREHNFW